MSRDAKLLHAALNRLSRNGGMVYRVSPWLMAAILRSHRQRLPDCDIGTGKSTA